MINLHKVVFHKLLGEITNLKMLEFLALPKADDEEDLQILSQHLTKRGAIPKSKLVLQGTYEGYSPYTRIAIWDGNDFCYVASAHGQDFIKKIKHYEDLSDEDVFVPIKCITNGSGEIQEGNSGNR